MLLNSTSYTRSFMVIAPKFVYDCQTNDRIRGIVNFSEIFENGAQCPKHIPIVREWVVLTDDRLLHKSLTYLTSLFVNSNEEDPLSPGSTMDAVLFKFKLRFSIAMVRETPASLTL